MIYPRIATIRKHCENGIALFTKQHHQTADLFHRASFLCAASSRTDDVLVLLEEVVCTKATEPKIGNQLLVLGESAVAMN